MADIILEALDTNYIPYNKKYIKDNIIFIPGYIIKTKNALFLSKSNYQIEANQFISHIYKLLNEHNLPIYVLLSNSELINPELYQIFMEYFFQHINSSSVSFIKSINEISLPDYFYVIRTSGAIWTLVTMFNYYYPIFNNKTIYVTFETYNRAIVIMTDEEISLLNNYNIIKINVIDEGLSNKFCVITQDTFKERGLFNYTIKYTPLNGGNRSPCRVIENLTTICPDCNYIVYYDINNVIRKHKPCNI
jgi:hypothetical protein